MQLSGEQSKLLKELAGKEKDLEKTLKANRIRTEKLASKITRFAKSWPIGVPPRLAR